MSINEEKLRAWIEQTDKKLEHLERNQMVIINGDFWGANTEPKEPLIKDAECRVIMRLWADRCGIKTVMLFGSEFRYGAKSICFGVDFGLEHPKLYTIDELCGEGERC